MADDGQEKTHEPTERKLKKAADEGQIVRSQEINSLAVLTCGAVGLALLGGPTGRAVGDLLTYCYTNTAPLDMGSAQALGWEASLAVVKACALPLTLIVVGVLAVSLLQSRFQMAPKALDPKVERLDPFKGFKNKFLSTQPIMELVKGVAKLFALGLIFWNVMKDLLVVLPSISTMHPQQQLWMLVDLAWEVVLWSLPLLAAVAMVDYAYNHWKHHEDQKMSTQEVKDERKETDGDPLLKAARRQRARQIAMGQVMSRVKEADMVVTNPTHYAVALRYRKDDCPAPIIVAMGVDHMALKIREEARKHDIPRIENRPLARALHARGKLGQAIPDELFVPVAKILAIVYRRRRVAAK